MNLLYFASKVLEGFPARAALCEDTLDKLCRGTHALNRRHLVPFQLWNPNEQIVSLLLNEKPQRKT
jgi:hypothetical protein|tara:strand:+ start:152 stop:349 length:198 start_codon:yes stop_codon:yes gene_type:complete